MHSCRFGCDRTSDCRQHRDRHQVEQHEEHDAAQFHSLRPSVHEYSSMACGQSGITRRTRRGAARIVPRRCCWWLMRCGCGEGCEAGIIARLIALCENAINQVTARF